MSIYVRRPWFHLFVGRDHLNWATYDLRFQVQLWIFPRPPRLEGEMASAWLALGWAWPLRFSAGRYPV